jgi:hypothetical protein
MRKNTSGPRFKALLEAANITTTGFAKFWGTEAQNVHNWYTRGVPAYRMEEVAPAVRQQRMAENRRRPQSHPPATPASNGDTFDAEAIRGVYTVVDPMTSNCPSTRKRRHQRLRQNPRHPRPRPTIRLPRAHLDNWKSATPTPSAPT